MEVSKCLSAGARWEEFLPLSHEPEAIFGAGILDVTSCYQNDRAGRPSLGIYYCTRDSFLY